MTEVLITAPCSDEVKRRLREFENSCVFSFGDRKSDIGDAEAVIGEPRTEKIRQAKSLKFIQMTWAGADIYTCDGAFPQGIRIATASGAFGGVISEYVVGAVLCLYRRFPEYIENQRSALWRDAGAERTLEGKTALILGTGDIGSNVAKRLSAFGTKNIGVRRTGAPAQYFEEIHTLSNLDSLLPQANLIIGCLPNTKETGHILDGKKIRPDEKCRAAYKRRQRKPHRHSRAHARTRGEADSGRGIGRARKRAARGGLPAVEYAECADNAAHIRARLRSRPGDREKDMGHLSRKPAPLPLWRGHNQ